jgi:type II secretory ATPase GspE/PulE/Tfp pilus assembly ATPase PilB-like protein
MERAVVANSIEKLREAVCAAFPEMSQLASVNLSSSIQETWKILVNVTGVTSQEFAAKIAAKSDLESVENLSSSQEAMRALPLKLVQANLCLPLNVENNILSVAICNPFDDQLLQGIRFASNYKVRFLIAPPENIEYAAQLSYSHAGDLNRNKMGTLSLCDSQTSAAGNNSVINLVKQLLREVIEIGSSDMHIQAFLGGGVVRARVDGMLRRILLLPEAVYLQLVRYFKANSGMDPTNSLIPQDGRLSLDIDGHDYELRLSALPTQGGERIVIRFLDQQKSFSLKHSGFSLAELQALRAMTSNSSGIILFTGPTGSGKTSTLYALLGELNSEFRNILTVENPVEYNLPGISQVDVHDKQGLTFSSVLRSALRQDPDIILVGEIRDEETANIACQAALTGHLVLSTLHTNDAISAIPRLLDFGIKPSILADTLVGVVAQRLCRRLCESCRIPVVEPLQIEETGFQSITRVAPAYRAYGCEECGFTGYSGRLPITEIITLSPALRKAIKNNPQSIETTPQDKLNSLSSLSSSAARHIISGDTSVSEAARIIGRRFWFDLTDEYKAEFPEMVLQQNHAEKTSSLSVLILGYGSDEETQLAQTYEKSLFNVYHAHSAQEAKEKLKTQDNIVHVIVNMDGNLSDDELVAYIRQARIDMAWSRLPALLLIPQGHDTLEKALIADGATSPCINKPVAPEKVVGHTRKALTGKTSTI